MSLHFVSGMRKYSNLILLYVVIQCFLQYSYFQPRLPPQRPLCKYFSVPCRRVLSLYRVDYSNVMSAMSVKTQFPKILTVCLREDTYYGTMWVTNDSITIQQLPSEYCAISTIEGNVLNVTFDFSYFDSRKSLLEYYPVEFKTKYEIYSKNKTLAIFG